MTAVPDNSPTGGRPGGAGPAARRARQATVADFDIAARTGLVRFDERTVLTFDAAVFDASPFRLLRPGQRVRVVVDDADTITELDLPSTAAG